MQKLLNTVNENIEGVHTPAVDSVPVRATVTQRGLMYEIDIFSADRHDISCVFGYVGIVGIINRAPHRN